MSVLSKFVRTRLLASMWNRLLSVPHRTSPISNTQPSKGWLKVVHNAKPFSRPRFSRHYFNYELFPPFSFQSCLANEVCAIANRAQAETPKVHKGELSNFIKHVKRNFHFYFAGYNKRRVLRKLKSPNLFSEYLSNSNAKPTVKRSLQRQHNYFSEHGIDHYSNIPTALCKRWTSRKAFIKVENNLYQNPNGVKLKAPRLIQGARPEFITLVGPFFYLVQKEIQKIWGKDSWCFFTSGASNVETGHYISQGRNRQIFANDVGKFDASICLELCQLEVHIAKLLGAPRAVLQLMNANCYTHGCTTHGCKYAVKGTRKSGDPYTSLFNSFLNAAMHMYCFHKSNPGMTLTNISKRLNMLVQGDDNLLSFSRELRPDFSPLEKLGFDCENVYCDLDTAEFCSSRLYHAGGSRVFGPKLGRLLAKLCCFCDPPDRENPYSIMNGIYLGYQHYFNFVPYLEAFLAPIYTNLLGAVEIPKQYQSFVSCPVSCSPLEYHENKILLSRWYRDMSFDDFESAVHFFSQNRSRGNVEGNTRLNFGVVTLLSVDNSGPGFF